MRTHVLGLVAALMAAAGVAAGQTADSSVDRRGRLGVELWAGRAHSSAQLGFLGSAPDLGLTLGALRVTHSLHRTERVVIDYMVDFVPIAHLSRRIMWNGTKIRIVCRRDETCATPADDILPKGSSDGLGVSPVGLAATLRPTRMLQLGFGGTGGIMYFDQRVPTSGAAQLNFTAMAEATVSLVDRHGIGPVLAYRFHHISNGGRADENAAIASNMISLGMRWRLTSASH